MRVVVWLKSFYWPCPFGPHNVPSMKLKEDKTYYDNGQLRSHCFRDNNYNIHGEFKTYHYNGQLCAHCFYKNSRFHGEYRSYHDDGELNFCCFYKNGKEITIKEWYDLQMKEKLENITQWRRDDKKRSRA